MKQIVYHLFLCIILFLFLVKSPAQRVPLYFNLVTGSNGISIGKVGGITQDKWGYIWFADQTNRCLTRYDGNRMKAFTNILTDTNSLDAGSFECIAADSSGCIWVDAKRGIDKFDPYSGRFIHFRYPLHKERGIQAILVDHSGTVWIGTNQGLDRLDQKTGTFINYQHKNNDSTSLSCNMVRALYEDHQGVLWVGTGFPFDTLKEGGLNKFDRRTGTFTRYMHDPANPHSIINDKVRAIFEDSKGTFWVGTQGDGLHIMDRKTGSFIRLTYDPLHPEKLSRPPVKKGRDYDHITFIKEDLSGDIWIGTYAEGLVRYDPITKQFQNFRSDKSRIGGFTDSTSWCAYISRDGTLWVATERDNLFRIDPLQRPIHNTPTPDQVNHFFRDNKSDLWVSTSGSGLFQYDQHENLIRHFKHDASDSQSLFENRVGPLFQGQDDTLWVGGWTGIRKLNTATNKFYRFSNTRDLSDSANTGIVRIFQDSKGIIWFVTWGRGLIRYNPKDNSFKHFLSQAEDSASISSNLLNSIVQESPRIFWIAGAGGINHFDSETGRFEHYLQDLFIGNIFEDSRGVLWAGTEKGLFTYSKKENKFIRYFDAQSGIASLPVGGFIEDNSKNLWITSFSSIIKLNPDTKEMFIYDSRFGIDGLAPWIIPYKNAQGKLFFGHNNGFYTFYPDELSTKKVFKILITDFFINSLPVLIGKGSVLKRPIEEISDLDLKYNQNNVAFNFAAIDYRNPDAIRYATMLEGYDNTWREVTGEKKSYYFNVTPGVYVYRIRAYDNDGTKAEKAITIRINPPWWQTWWAYSLYAILLIVAVWAFIKWRTKVLQKEKIILEEKVAKRTKELKEEKELVERTLSELKITQAQLIQSEKMASLGELTAGIAHEIQNPLNFVNNFSEVNKELLIEMKDEIKKRNFDEVASIAKNIEDNEEKINHHGKRADAIVKGMLQHSRNSSGIKEPTDINVLADEYLRLSYHGLRAKDKLFNATMKTDFDESIGKINIIPQDIGRVLLNLYNNAFYAVAEKNISTSSAGQHYEPIVSVSTKKVNSRVEIKVADNGNGIPQKVMDKIFQPFFTTKPTGQGTGLGLSLSYDTIKAHGGQIKVETKEGEGSEFYIVLPA